MCIDVHEHASSVFVLPCASCIVRTHVLAFLLWCKGVWNTRHFGITCIGWACVSLEFDISRALWTNSHCAEVCVCVTAGARVLHVGTTHSGTFSSRRTDSLLRLLPRRALTWLYLVVNPDKQIFAFGNMRMLVVESL